MRVLVVDDDEDVRTLLTAQLEQSGLFEVVGDAATGADAVLVAGECHPELVLLDALLDEGDDGIEAIPALRSAPPRPPVVIVYTADTGTATRDRAMAAGASAVVGKEDPFSRLIGIAARLLPKRFGEITPSPPSATASADSEFAERMRRLLESDTQRERAKIRARTRRRAIIVALVLLPFLVTGAYVIAVLAGFSIR